MSVNSSSSSNTSLNSLPSPCLNSISTVLISTAFSVTRIILLLPLSILILYLGLQQWRQHRSFTSASHSDIFTYHLAAMELIWVLGSGLSFCSITTDLPVLMIVCIWLQYISYYGESLFHQLTCLERYLAVVHPITYRGLRKARGVKIRNVSIGCTWLLSFGLTAALSVKSPALPQVTLFCPLAFSFIAISFCSLSVLRVLTRPGPGNGGQNKERADQLKERVFLTIMAIMGVLWLWFVANLVSTALSVSQLLSPSVSCVLRASALWFSLPSTLVLPLLYLHRAGKLSCCGYNNG